MVGILPDFNVFLKSLQVIFIAYDALSQKQFFAKYVKKVITSYCLLLYLRKQTTLEAIEYFSKE